MYPFTNLTALEGFTALKNKNKKFIECGAQTQNDKYGSIDDCGQCV